MFWRASEAAPGLGARGSGRQQPTWMGRSHLLDTVRRTACLPAFSSSCPPSTEATWMDPGCSAAPSSGLLLNALGLGTARRAGRREDAHEPTRDHQPLLHQCRSMQCTTVTTH